MAFPGTYNFNYYRGDTFTLTLNPKDSTGNAFSLTGYTAAFTIANQRGPGATQYTGTTSINTSTNTITCTIPAATGRNFAAGTTWVYDVQITNGVAIYTILTGTLTPTNDITGAV